MSDGIIRTGVHRPLEDEANRLLRESLKGVTRHCDKADILTPWKEQSRYSREVYVASGVPDQSTRKGMFHRSINAARPDLNSRDGIARNDRSYPSARRATGLADFVASEHAGGEE